MALEFAVSSLVTLRRSTVADAELIHTWRSEPSALAYQPMILLPLEDVRTMLAERATVPISPSAIGKIQWTVETPDGPAGWITLSFSAEDRRHRKAAIGYPIGEQFRGRGLFRYRVEQDGQRMPMTPLPIAPAFRPEAEFDRRVAAAGAHTSEILRTEG